MPATSERLGGKVAIVTGAGSRHRNAEIPGCGQAIALLCASNGAEVVIVDRDAEAAAFTAKHIAEEGGSSITIVADVTRSEDCARVAAEAMATFGRIDVLVNNVGDHQQGSVVTLTEDDWDYMHTSNLKSVFWMSKYVLPHMLRARAGSIVNMGSSAGSRGSGGAAHAAAKGGLHALTVDMAVTHGKGGVRVNCVSAGHLHTPIGSDTISSIPGFDDIRAFRRDSTPLGIEGTAWDAAHAVLYFAGNESRYVTGVIHPVDAGLEATTSTMQRFAQITHESTMAAVAEPPTD